MSSLTCERCGGSLRAQDGTSLLRCPYCGDTAQLAPAVVEQLSTYRRGVAAHVAEADEQAQFADAYARVSGAASTASAPASAEAISGAQCSSCGGTNRFEVGATFATCVHCGASLLANAPIQARGLSAAARAAHAARLEALKGERYFAVKLARKNRFLSYQPAVFAPSET